MIQRALVTDGKESTTLAVVKSLGKSGVQVTVGDDCRLAPSRFSKYCSRFFSYPSPLSSASRFLERLLDELKKSRAEMFFLTSDTQMPVVMKYWNEISKLTRIAAPPPETLLNAYDKSKTLALAQSLSIPIPKTIRVTSNPSCHPEPPKGAKDLSPDAEILRTCGPQNDIVELVKRHLTFPVVVKYNQTYFWKKDRLCPAPRVQYAYTAEDLRAKLAKADFENQSVLLQEFIAGPGVGLFGLFQNGRPRVLFSHERLREANPTGGASAEARSIPVGAKAKEMACALMKALNWTGVAMIELKKNINTGELKLMEINGRFWGSLPLALRCGVDFPVLLARMMETGKGPGAIDYPTGVRGRHLNRYFTHLLHVLKGKPKGWPGPYPGRFETLWDLVKIRQKGLFYYGLESADPLPEIADLLFWVQSNATKLFRR